MNAAHGIQLAMKNVVHGFFLRSSDYFSAGYTLCLKYGEALKVR